MAANRSTREGLTKQLAGAGFQSIGNGRFAKAGADGAASENFYDDPTVNALVDLPSTGEAAKFTGASPSFYGVQRPGDWQRVVQRQMAAEQVGGMDQLARLMSGRVERERRNAGLV